MFPPTNLEKDKPDNLLLPAFGLGINDGFGQRRQRLVGCLFLFEGSFEQCDSIGVIELAAPLLRRYANT
jgi:hypothetical protein